MVTRERTYEEIALANPDRKLELHDGRLVEKPPMSIAHGYFLHRAHDLLRSQLDPESYWVRLNHSRLQRPETTYFIPDICVIPVDLTEPDVSHWGELDLYKHPLPLVVEVWSPSTGDYDVDTKFAEYRRRGDAEIWRLHSFDRTLTIWRRQEGSSYDEIVLRQGVVRPIALPGVAIDLDAFFSVPRRTTI